MQNLIKTTNYYYYYYHYYLNDYDYYFYLSLLLLEWTFQVPLYYNSIEFMILDHIPVIPVCPQDLRKWNATNLWVLGKLSALIADWSWISQYLKGIFTGHVLFGSVPYHNTTENNSRILMNTPVLNFPSFVLAHYLKSNNSTHKQWHWNEVYCSLLQKGQQPPQHLVNSPTRWRSRPLMRWVCPREILTWHSGPQNQWHFLARK